MNDLLDYSFRKILAVSASDAPTPGGGSVSALVGALGVAMAAMVGNLTVGRPKYAGVETQVKELTGRAYFIMASLENLINSDITAFAKFMEAYRMTKKTDEDKVKRGEAIQKAAKAATNVPMDIARTLLDALHIIEELSRIGNKMAISDAGVAAYVCEAAINAVLLNVDINVPMITDTNFVVDVNKEKDTIIVEARRLKELAVGVVKERIQG